MRMQDMVPPEAYQNIHSNMRHAITTGTVSTAHHELDLMVNAIITRTVFFRWMRNTC